jgi:predicted nucleic acid-binding protein
VSAATIDCLIAAHTIEAAGRLLTVGDDFGQVAKHTALRLVRLPSP